MTKFPRILVKWVLIMLLAAAWGATLATTVLAANVNAALSARETYVGLPVTLQIRIENAADHEPPEIPDVDGLTITSAGTAGQSHRITIINGRRSESSTITYGYQVTPSREGAFTIPPISVHVDGRTVRTRELALVAAKSDTGDLLFAEISGKRDEIYVGEPLELTLKFWIKPFRDKRLGVTLSEGQTWQLLSDQSSWGMFADRLQELAAENKRPAGAEVLREDRAGDRRSYYLYEIDTTVYPQRPDAIDGDEVRVVVNYPTALSKSRSLIDEFFNNNDFPFRQPAAADDDFFSPFSSGLRIASYRPIVAKAEVERVRVKAIPTAGRPSDYRGAVGQYKMITEARPTKVKAGDPITLRIGVVGTGPMDLVQAPPLAELEDLTQDFKVPDEPLAGLVDEQRHTKLFSTSIRPRAAGVTQIPAIPFSYFDPAAEKFVTVRSNPISIEVEPADTLALDAIVSQQTPKDPASRSTKSFDVTSTRLPDSFENYRGAELLVDETATRVVTLPMMLTLLAPPVLLLTIQLIRVGGQLGDRFRAAHHVCTKRIRAAEQPAEVGRALRSFLARKFRLPDDAKVAAAIGKLRTAGHGELAIRLERALTECERCESMDGGRSGTSLEKLKAESIELVAAVRALRAKPTVRPSTWRKRAASSTSRLLSVLLILCCTVGLVEATAAEPLTVDQQRALLVEANRAYDQARGGPQPDAADAKLIFSRAAEKYQLIVDADVRNSRLYFNLANAYLQGGRTGRAIANYYRALSIDPTNVRFRKNLRYALSLAPSQHDDSAAMQDASGWSWVQRVNDGLAAYVNPNWMRWLCVFSWVGFWAAIGFRVLRATHGIGLPWRTLAVLCILVATVTGMSYALAMRQYRIPNLAVIVEPDVALKEADGAQFATVAEWHAAEGGVVQVLQSRSQWLKVQTSAGQTGWLPRQYVEIINPVKPTDEAPRR